MYETNTNKLFTPIKLKSILAEKRIILKDGESKTVHVDGVDYIFRRDGKDLYYSTKLT